MGHEQATDQLCPERRDTAQRTDVGA